VDIASASEAADPGSNPAMEYVRFLGKQSNVFCVFDLICIVGVLKRINKGSGPKLYLKSMYYNYLHTTAALYNMLDM
jgi:hypothetical protein